MTIGNFSMIQELIEFNRIADRLGMKAIDWGVVTLPVHPRQPDTGLVSVGQLMGINAQASNPDDAWEFIRFHHSEARAKQLARSTSVMSSLKSANRAPEGLDYDPEVFSRLKGAKGLTEAERQLYQDMPNLTLVRSIGSMIFARVLSGELTVEQGLEEWERAGNDLLQKIKQNPDGTISLDGLLPNTGSGKLLLPPADGIDEGQFLN